MTDWDERFAAGDYPREPEPSPVLRSYEPSIPDGRALDVAAGTGRNAVFLAEAGYAVDALDASREGLRIIGERATEEGIEERIEPIRGDVATYGFPSEAYELITMSFFHTLDRFADLAEALVPGGYLFVEGHLRSASATPSGPSDDRYRFAANELLRAGLGLTVLYYDETTEERPDDRRRATARLLARRSTGGRQSYPPRPPEDPGGE
ncbi:class I SAM-dependent methyltransferase [Halorubrum sp. CBA1229]|uniref:class I SAM-dependent methyltransferase n=1 Tax=Halorubrum sp. CBA1229 TaxID=1853699 RepID=UPI000F3E8438|nr:class I SAM-dependent methyltransferase [Halorubrum sp. CBA1229]QKY17843.1 methyltransferase domain-containing protein [Halorubrum sp. CBA1229]